MLRCCRLSKLYTPTSTGGMKIFGAWIHSIRMTFRALARSTSYSNALHSKTTRFHKPHNTSHSTREKLFMKRAKFARLHVLEWPALVSFPHVPICSAWMSLAPIEIQCHSRWSERCQNEAPEVRGQSRNWHYWRNHVWKYRLGQKRGSQISFNASL